MFHFVRNVFRYLKTGFDPRNKLRGMILLFIVWRGYRCVSWSLNLIFEWVVACLLSDFHWTQHSLCSEPSSSSLFLSFRKDDNTCDRTEKEGRERMASFDISQDDQSLPRYPYKAVFFPLLPNQLLKASIVPENINTLISVWLGEECYGWSESLLCDDQVVVYIFRNSIFTSYLTISSKTLLKIPLNSKSWFS